MSTEILYVVDPMCSWCYGFAPALAEVLAELAPGTTTRLVMGGLAPDSDDPMPEALQSYVQEAWRTVEAKCGVPFNHDFWTTCQPRRSSYPACRAVIAARLSRSRNPGVPLVSADWQMLSAIQRAYYTEARNPSDRDTLIELAAEIGLDRSDFASQLESSEIADELTEDFALRDQLMASGFPSLGLVQGGLTGPLASGCLNASDLRQEFAKVGLLAPRARAN